MNKKWKQELKKFYNKVGLDFEYLCVYVETENQGLPGFYRKTLKTKELH